MVSGAGLAASGLMMQTLFRNPLAGPSVLGITSGSSLAMALMVMAGVPILSGLSSVLVAFVGAGVILLLILLADMRTRNSITLLIIGLMIGYLCSALISVIELASDADKLKGFVIWGLGSFDGVSLVDLKILLPIAGIGLLFAMFLSHSLNGLLLGTEHARSLGMNVHLYKRMILLCTGVLAALITAYVGPIAFLGLAVPHVTRAFFRTSDHRLLMPAVMLTGALLALGCDLIRHIPEERTIPLNAVTSMIGAPVILWILVKGRQWFGAS